MTEFVPAQFGKLGKKIGDLFKKQYAFEHQVSTKHKSGALTVEAGAKNSTNGFSEASYDAKDYKVAFKGNTTANHEVEATLKQPVKGAEVVLWGDSQPAGSIEASYAQDFFAVQSKVKSDGKKTSIKGSGTIGHDDVTCGGAVEVDDKAALKNYDVGCEWAQKDFTVSCFTENKGNAIRLAYFQTLSAATAVGAQFWHNPEDDVKRLNFGSEHKLDDKTTVKAKGDTDGIVAATVEHRLIDKLILGTSAEFNALSKDRMVAQKFGVSLKFGDY